MTDLNGDLLGLLAKASDELKMAAIEALKGEVREERTIVAAGPLLLGMGKAAELLGVSRGTLWRMCHLGRMDKVEVLPGSYRIRRIDIEELALKPRDPRGRKRKEA